jgi:hypothetical protein
LAETITDAIPNRLAYFDALPLYLYPVGERYQLFLPLISE